MDRIAFLAKCVIDREFSLDDGDVDDFVGAAAIAGCINIGIRGLLKTVGDDLAVGRCPDPSLVEPEKLCAGLASESVQTMRGPAGDFFSLMFEQDLDLVSNFSDFG